MGGKRKRGGKGGGKGGKGGGKGAKREEEAQDDVAAEHGDEELPGKRARGEGGNVWRDDPSEWTQTNASFEAYYQRQRVCSEEEWPRLLEALRTGLPVAIRVNRMRHGASALSARLRELRDSCGSDADRECYAPQALAWYPHGLGWQWPGLERRTIKKDRRHVRLKDYLAQRERSGIISRQEVVSMLPPMFLGVEPHHRVLDLCAAPGSKTSQMLEMMHWAHAADASQGLPSGLVMANELQWRRANMLAHQVQRLGSPCISVVNVDAQFFPELWSPAGADGTREPFRFDRVLCDVPCSGDGTMRKTPYIWKSWTLRDGLALHIRQLNILYRGLDLLKVGGRLVYSTCSLNPMEDEAVVAAALRRHGSSIALVPPPPPLHEDLKAGRGLRRWVVPHPREEGVFFESYADVPSEMKEGKLKLLPSMFPPSEPDTDPICASLEEGCRRLLPHLMDTGGFFVATFEKRSELPPSAKAKRAARNEAMREERSAKAQAEAGQTSAEVPTKQDQDQEQDQERDQDQDQDQDQGEEGEQPEEEEQAEEQAQDEGKAEAKPAPQQARPPSSKQATRRVTNEYVRLDQADWQEISNYYGLNPDISHRFVVRTGGQNGAFLLSEGLDQLLMTETRLPTRMVICGVLAFQRAKSYHILACPWQLAQEGLAALCALGLRRRISVKRPLLRRLLTERDVPLADIQAAALSGDVVGLEAVADPASQSGGLLPGSLAVLLHDDGPEASEAGPRGPPLAVAAAISDDALELAAGNAEVAALLEDLCGQPSAEEILGPPGGVEAEQAQGAEGAEGAEGAAAGEGPAAAAAPA